MGLKMGRAENDLQYAEKGLIMQSNLGVTYTLGTVTVFLLRFVSTRMTLGRLVSASNMMKSGKAENLLDVRSLFSFTSASKLKRLIRS